MTTLSVPISGYILHIHAGRRDVVATAPDNGSRGRGDRSRPPRCGAVFLGKALQLYMPSLDPGVNGYLVGQ